MTECKHKDKKCLCTLNVPKIIKLDTQDQLKLVRVLMQRSEQRNRQMMELIDSQVNEMQGLLSMQEILSKQHIKDQERQLHILNGPVLEAMNALLNITPEATEYEPDVTKWSLDARYMDAAALAVLIHMDTEQKNTSNLINMETEGSA